MGGGIGGAISAALATDENYGDTMALIWTADREPSSQGGYQFATLAVTMAIAISSGVFSSIMIKNITSSDQLTPFSDAGQWTVPEKEAVGTYFPLKSVHE